MAKGDRVSITVRDVKEPFVLTASQNGRKLEGQMEKVGNSQWFVIKELTRGGTTVRSVKVPAMEILAIDLVQKEID